MDVLSTLLRDVRADGAVFRRDLLSPPWSLRFEDRAELMITVALRDGAHLRLDEGAAVDLGEGDIAIVTGGRSVTLSDGGPQTAPARYVALADGTCTGPDGEPFDDRFLVGPRTCGEDTDSPHVVLTGSYHVRSAVPRRFLASLPPVLHLPYESGPCPIMDLTVLEIDRDQPGQQAVLDRLLDLLLLSTLREWFARRPADTPGWFVGLDDPVAGPALRRMHSEPATPWTVAALADAAGVSRATLARRFSTIVGETPMAYLRSLRLALAEDLLRDSEGTVDTVARAVGYQDGFALSVAFKRETGMRPSEVRRRAA